MSILEIDAPEELQIQRSFPLTESNFSEESYEDDGNDDSDGDDDDSTEQVDEDDYQEQYVHLIEYSSYQSKFKDAVPRNTGVERLCSNFDTNSTGNNAKEECRAVWQFFANEQPQQLIVSFGTALLVQQISVHETSNPGSITTIELLQPEQNKFLVMWKGKPSSNDNPSDCITVFEPKLRQYRFLSNTIRLTFQSHDSNPIGIQTIKMFGSSILKSCKDQLTIVQSMKALYRNAMNQVDTDVKFCIDDRVICAHKNILSCRSTYFRALLSENYKEGKQTEPIRLTDVDYQTFLQILHFIYTANYDSSMSFDIAMNTMFYANKITYLTAKDAAIDYIACYLRMNYKDILIAYSSIKNFSPSFDLLLEIIYDICADNLSEICKQTEFLSLDKESLVDLVCHAAARREEKEKAPAPEVVEPLTNEDIEDTSSEDDF